MGRFPMKTFTIDEAQSLLPLLESLLSAFGRYPVRTEDRAPTDSGAGGVCTPDVLGK